MKDLVTYIKESAASIPYGFNMVGVKQQDKDRHVMWRTTEFWCKRSILLNNEEITKYLESYVVDDENIDGNLLDEVKAIKPKAINVNHDDYIYITHGWFDGDVIWRCEAFNDTDVLKHIEKITNNATAKVKVKVWKENKPVSLDDIKKYLTL